MKKQEILSYLKTNVATISNSTRKNNIKQLELLAKKHLTKRNYSIRINNIGDIAELVMVEYLGATPTPCNEHGDGVLNGEVIELKCCLNGDSHKVWDAKTTYILAKKGLYKLSPKQVKSLVGKRITNSDLKEYTPIKTFEDLLKE